MRNNCKIKDCGRFAFGNLLCQKHYLRNERHGSPYVTVRMPPDTPLIDRLEYYGWNKVVRKQELGECWEWKGRVDNSGYGVLKFQGKVVRPHRAMWQIHNATTLLPGINALHRCDNPPCMNPAHIFPGTQQQNIADMHQKGRGGCNRVLTEDQVVEMKRLYRTGKYKQAEIEKMFKSSSGQLSRIMNQKTWAHVA